jgi:hypothetical protein
MGAEQRKFPRRGIELVVQIRMVDGSIARAVLLDLSQSGARLKVPNPHILPEQFLLKMDSRIQRRARIVWRSDQEIGVEFLQAPKNQTNQPPHARFSSGGQTLGGKFQPDFG